MDNSNRTIDLSNMTIQELVQELFKLPPNSRVTFNGSTKAELQISEDSVLCNIIDCPDN